MCVGAGMSPRFRGITASTRPGAVHTMPRALAGPIREADTHDRTDTTRIDPSKDYQPRTPK